MSIYCESHPDAPLIEDYRAGDVICSSCGLVLLDRAIDVSCEWRTFMNDDNMKDNSRVGAIENPQMEGRDLTTRIGKATGNTGFDSQMQYRNNYNETTHDKAVRIANGELKDMAERLNVDNSVISKAQHIFYEIYSKKQIRDRRREPLLGTCMYIACQQTQVPRTFKEIAAVCSLIDKDITCCYKKVKKLIKTPSETQTPEQYIQRLRSKLSLDMRTEKLAKHMVNRANALDLISSQRPMTIAAAAVYMATIITNSNVSIKEIAVTSGIAESTIKTTYKKFKPHATELMPKDSKI